MNKSSHGPKEGGAVKYLISPPKYSDYLDPHLYALVVSIAIIRTTIGQQ